VGVLMKKNFFIFAVVIIAAFLCVGAVSASNVTNTTMKKTVSVSTSKNVAVTKSTSKIIKGSGCCSVLVHVKKGYDVFAFRRDSTYTANLYIKRSKWYGKDTIKEYKTVHGYFFHTIVSTGGWIVATGGPDIPSLNRKLEALAGRTSVSGHITHSTLNSAYGILRSEGMGHFIIKAPNGNVGLVIYNGGRTKEALFKMANGQYVSVPNGPGYYRSGYTSTINPISSAIHLETTDRWGANRRNIITYQVMNTNYATQVKIWASTSRGTPDNIYFGGKKIGKYTLPKIPNKKYIGQVNLKTPQISSTNPTNLMTDVNRTTSIEIKFSENIKTSTYFKNINIKDLTTNKYVTITKTIIGNTLNIQTTATRNVDTWYQVTIPAAAIKDIAGNNLLATYTFKFKTGT
jgi:hypothetical protein